MATDEFAPIDPDDFRALIIQLHGLAKSALLLTESMTSVEGTEQLIAILHLLFTYATKARKSLDLL